MKTQNAKRKTQNVRREIRSSNRLSPHGFTLLELLLALALTLVVASALAAAMYTAFRARTSAEDTVQSAIETSAAGDDMAREMANALAPTPPTLTAGTIQGLSGANTTGVIVGSFEGLVDNVDFFVAGPEPKANVQGDVREVVYLLETDPNNKSGGQVLARRVTSNLLASQKNPQPDEVICRNVTNFHLSYFDGTDWNDTWDSTAETGTLLNSLPMAVEITIELAPFKRGGDVRHTVRYVPLSCFKPQNQVVPTVTTSGGTVKGL